MHHFIERLFVWDERVSARVFRTRRVWFFDVMFGFFSTIGQGGAVWFVLGICLQVLTRQDELFLMLVLSEVLQFVVVGMGIKAVVKRMRPQTEPSVLPLWLGWGEYSFPSGHSASSMTAVVVLSHYLPGGRWALFALALLCGLSRLYLRKHYVLDILAGFIIGALVGIFVLLFV